MLDATVAVQYPMGLPRDVWALIAGQLDLDDLGRFAQVCAAFHHVVSVSNGKVLDTWFRELIAQCHDEGGQEAQELLGFVQKNMRNTKILLPVLDKLLVRPQPGEAVSELDDPVLKTADALARQAYADPKNNSRDTLRRALMSIIEHNDHLIARSGAIVSRDKIFDQRIEMLPYMGLGLVVLGLIVQFSQFGNQGSMLHLPFMGSGFLLGVSRFYKETGVVDYYKYRGFFRKVDVLPNDEWEKLPNLKRIKEGYSEEWNALKFALKLSGVALVGVLLLAYLLVQLLTRDMHANHTPQTRGLSGP